MGTHQFKPGRWIPATSEVNGKQSTMTVDLCFYLKGARGSTSKDRLVPGNMYCHKKCVGHKDIYKAGSSLWICTTIYLQLYAIAIVHQMLRTKT